MARTDRMTPTGTEQTIFSDDALATVYPRGSFDDSPVLVLGEPNATLGWPYRLLAIGLLSRRRVR